jgi:hypothetical protein
MLAPVQSPGSLPQQLASYLDDKGIEHRIFPSTYLADVGRTKMSAKRLELHLFDVPAKMLRHVLLKEFEHLAKPWGRKPSPSFTFRKYGVIKKIKIRF